MNGKAAIGVILVLVIVAAVLGYAYAAEVELSNSLRSSNSSLDQKVAGLSGQVSALASNYTSLKSNYETLQSEISQLNGNISQLNTDLQNNQTNVVLDQAFAHWDYIAIENATLLAPQYTPNATLMWIGGPLTGTYSGLNSIESTWNKFFGLWSAVWFYTESPPVVATSGGIYTVSATVQWVLTSLATPQQVNTIVTNYTIEMHYFGGKPLIVMEVWHIISVGVLSYSAKEVESLQTEAMMNASFSHWNNIAIENISLVMSQYMQNSSLQWIGGKLAGNYTNYSQIQSVWTKFFGLWNAIWFYSEAPPLITVNFTQGSAVSGTVTADIQFVVQSSSNTSAFDYINVVYTIDFNVINQSFIITHEVFDNVGIGPLSQVSTFA
ncbi:MAG: hypothetical protein M1526_05105 [Candidatus Thermoplasmatota archaeon]|nr:hypothetical protein [Candidatus Thermoplasmatota archaeon]MCL5681321.1 hypothetical protein [Candidatus Thermoplasmatota archaeon]